MILPNLAVGTKNFTFIHNLKPHTNNCLKLKLLKLKKLLSSLITVQSSVTYQQTSFSAYIKIKHLHYIIIYQCKC